MELYEKVFGRYLSGAIKQGNNLVIKCLWHNDSNPSLSISTDPNKPVYKCWACGKSGSLIGAYMELNNVDYKTAMQELGNEVVTVHKPKYVTTIKKEKEREKDTIDKNIELEFKEYCNKATDLVVNNYELYCKKLFELRGITMVTAVNCGIGYDKSKGWIFPIIRYPDHKYCGYEIRHKYFQKFDFNDRKCYKATGSKSCLSITSEGFDNKKAIICEGFIDSYKMFQYLYIKSGGDRVEETILTCSMGVQSIPKLVKDLELWNKFDEVLFVLDNDEAGNKVTAELMEISNQHEGKFKFFGGLEVGEDFENWYDEKIK